MPPRKQVVSPKRIRRKANYDGLSVSRWKTNSNSDLLNMFSQFMAPSATVFPSLESSNPSYSTGEFLNVNFDGDDEDMSSTQDLSHSAEEALENHAKNIGPSEECDELLLRREGQNDLWQALPAVVESDCDEDEALEELPCSTESCVVEVPQAESYKHLDDYKDFNNASDVGSSYTEDDILSALESEEYPTYEYKNHVVSAKNLKWDPDAIFLEVDRLVENFDNTIIEPNLGSKTSPLLSPRESNCSDSGLSSSPEGLKPEELDVSTLKCIPKEHTVIENIYNCIDETSLSSHDLIKTIAGTVPEHLQGLGPVVLVDTLEIVDEGPPQHRIRFDLGSTPSLTNSYESKTNSQHPLVLNAFALLETARHKWSQSMESLHESVHVLQQESAYLTRPIWQGVSQISSNFSHTLHRAYRQIQLRYITTARDTSWLPRLHVAGSIHGQHGFEELRKHVKEGGDFCKELAAILQERSELETNYAKGLSKLGAKLAKITRELDGSIHAAWHSVGTETEAEAEIHKALSVALAEELVKPMRSTVDTQHRVRKSVEATVDKSGRALADWRQAQVKAKKQNYVCARDNEKMQDQIFIEARLGRPRPMTEKESAKLDSKRRKTEEAMKKADIEYYSCCVRAEQARLEWESATSKGSHCFQTLEEDRLSHLKDLVEKYHTCIREMGPKLTQTAERLCIPVSKSNVSEDLHLVHALKDSGTNLAQLLLPDFYAEHMSNVMNRDRRKESLERCLHLIRADLEREVRGKRGLENLSRALSQSPHFGNEETQHDVVEKLNHLKAMLAFLEASRLKVHNAIAEMDSKPKLSHPLTRFMEVHKDKQGLVQTLLKLPSWLDDHDVEPEQEFHDGPLEWTDRGMADGTSGQPDSDFDEFSSQDSDCDYTSVAETVVANDYSLKVTPSVGRCKALYAYTAKMYDELNIEPGDIINIHDKQPDGWWLGELRGIVGIFPATYVEEMES